MGTAIEWTGETWNPTTGCDRVSPGCDNCYAMKMAGRLKKMGQAKYQRDGDPRTSGPGFGLTLHPDVLDAPLKRKKPTTYFVDSMSDLFHPGVPDEFILDVFTVMARASQHSFQVLTKRPQRMAALVDRICWRGCSYPTGDIFNADLSEATAYLSEGEGEEGLPNVWLGTSIESDRYTWRADHLRATPASVRFLSLEPLLGPLPSLELTGISWVIVGAESGRGARPMADDWVRAMRDRCVEAGIPFFLKQQADASGRKLPLPELDGRTWDEMPEHAGAVA